jgi:hypothetical protein
MVLNSTTMMKTYIDDIICLTLSSANKTKDNQKDSSHGNLIQQQNDIQNIIRLNNLACNPWEEDITYPKITNAELNNLLVNLHTIGNKYAGSVHAHTVANRSLKEEADDVMQQLLTKFKENCMIENPVLSFDLPKDDSIERLLYSEVSQKEIKFHAECSIGISDFLQIEMKGFIHFFGL